jgi:carbon monoxide dehydrogenase subunit G
MNLSGEATLHAGAEQVYAALNDPTVLARTIPGCRRLEPIGADVYKATVVAGIAAIKGTFDGEVRLADQTAPHSFTLHASGVGAPGTVTAVVRIALTPEGGQTMVRYDADATVGGVIGGVGQRMIAGVARKTAQEFFAAVDREFVPAMLVEPPTAVMPAVIPALVAQRPARASVRDLVLAASFGAVIALVGVIVGALIAGF